MIGLAGACLLLGACPMATPDGAGPGQNQVGRVPPQAAMDLNREGKALYREGHFADARAKYESARRADPGFLAPWLNLACAYAREERFADATLQAAALIRHAYVPGAREVMEAADLGALQIRPEWLSKLKSALSDASLEWGRATQGSLFFVARTRPAVKLEGQGVLVLGLNQEIFAWQPGSGRFLQVTDEDGRVLAFVQSPDGRKLVFVRAGRLVRSPGQPDLLRGLSLRRLDLDRMVVGPAVELPDDVRELTIWSSASGSTGIRAAGPTRAVRALRFDGETLQDAGSGQEPPPGGTRAIVLSAAGVAPTSRLVTEAACAFAAHDQVDPHGLPGVRVAARRAKPFFLDARYGAGLAGLPFPIADSPASKALSPAKKTR